MSTKKASAKDLRVFKNESYKSHVQSLLAKREQVYKEHKEEMFKKPKINGVYMKLSYHKEKIDIYENVASMFI